MYNVEAEQVVEHAPGYTLPNLPLQYDNTTLSSSIIPESTSHICIPTHCILSASNKDIGDSTDRSKSKGIPRKEQQWQGQLSSRVCQVNFCRACALPWAEESQEYTRNFWRFQIRFNIRWVIPRIIDRNDCGEVSSSAFVGSGIKNI